MTASRSQWPPRGVAEPGARLLGYRGSRCLCGVAGVLGDGGEWLWAGGEPPPPASPLPLSARDPAGAAAGGGATDGRRAANGAGKGGRGGGGGSRYRSLLRTVPAGSGAAPPLRDRCSGPRAASAGRRGPAGG